MGPNGMEQIIARLNRDLRSAPRPLHLELRRDEDGDLEWFLGEPGGLGSSMSANLEDHEVLSLVEVERWLVDLADGFAGTLWPDDLTTPWPACPRSPEHPLMPALVRGRAMWQCERGHAVEVPIGEFPTGRGN